MKTKVARGGMRGAAGGVVLATILLAAGCGGGSGDSSSSGSGSSLSGTIEISGSSTVEPVSVRVAELFEDQESRVRINVDGPGTGDGFRLFCDGETDISNASRPIQDLEADICADNGINWIELKVAIDGITVITSDDNNAIDCISYEQLYALIGPESRGFNNWNDANTIAAELGDTAVLPNADLDIFGPGEESGTFDSFVELVIEDFAEAREQEATTRPDYSSSADDNIIISGIARSSSAIGWVGYAFAANVDGIKLLEVDGGSGCVSPSEETIASGEYPVSRPLFVYVNADNLADNPAIAAYVDFYLTSSGLETAVSEVGYVILDSAEQQRVRSNWTSRRVNQRE